MGSGYGWPHTSDNSSGRRFDNLSHAFRWALGRRPDGGCLVFGTHRVTKHPPQSIVSCRVCLTVALAQKLLCLLSMNETVHSRELNVKCLRGITVVGLEMRDDSTHVAVLFGRETKGSLAQVRAAVIVSRLGLPLSAYERLLGKSVDGIEVSISSSVCRSEVACDHVGWCRILFRHPNDSTEVVWLNAQNEHMHKGFEITVMRPAL